MAGMPMFNRVRGKFRSVAAILDVRYVAMGNLVDDDLASSFSVYY